MSYHDDLIHKDIVKELRDLRKACEKEQQPVAMVSIPLEQYLALRDGYEEVCKELQSLMASRDVISILLSKIDISLEELEIKPGSIYYEHRDNPLEMRRQHIITFQTDGGK